MRRLLAVLSMAVLSLAPAGRARGDFTTVDQQNVFTPNPGDPQQNGVGISGFAPLGQSFTPTLAAINAAEFRISDPTNNGLGATLDVILHQGGITGAVLGTSDAVTLPDNFSPAFGGSPVLFTFASTIPLVPGDTYTLELHTVAGDNDITLERTPGGYAGGFAYFSGNPSTGSDLYFREGLATVPEPASVALLGIGALGLLALGRDRRAPRTSANRGGGPW